MKRFWGDTDPLQQNRGSRAQTQTLNVFVNFCPGRSMIARQPQVLQMSVAETGQMSSVGAAWMPAVETGQMSAVETRQMTSAGKRQISTSKTRRCPVSLFYICLVPAADICLASTADICPVSKADIYPVSTEDARKLPAAGLQLLCLLFESSGSAWASGASLEAPPEV